jgi:hypothetical protein
VTQLHDRYDDDDDDDGQATETCRHQDKIKYIVVFD